jgi:hypothetical protein
MIWIGTSFGYGCKSVWVGGAGHTSGTALGMRVFLVPILFSGQSCHLKPFFDTGNDMVSRFVSVAFQSGIHKNGMSFPKGGGSILLPGVVIIVVQNQGVGDKVVPSLFGFMRSCGWQR